MSLATVPLRWQDVRPYCLKFLSLTRESCPRSAAGARAAAATAAQEASDVKVAVVIRRPGIQREGAERRPLLAAIPGGGGADGDDGGRRQRSGTRRGDLAAAVIVHGGRREGLQQRVEGDLPGEAAGGGDEVARVCGLGRRCHLAMRARAFRTVLLAALQVEVRRRRRRWWAGLRGDRRSRRVDLLGRGFEEAGNCAV